MSFSCASESVTSSVITLTEGVERPNRNPNTTLMTATDISEIQLFRLVRDFLDLISAISTLFEDAMNWIMELRSTKYQTLTCIIQNVSIDVN